MRIDFSQLDKQDNLPPPLKPALDHTLANVWQKEEDKTIQQLSAVKQENAVNFFVTYPYEISRSLSPEAVKKEMSYLKAKQVLPSATLNFIEQAIKNQQQIKVTKINYEEKSFQSPEHRHHSYYFQNSHKFSQSKKQKSKNSKSKNSNSKNSKDSMSPRKHGQLVLRTQKRAQLKADKMNKITNDILYEKKSKQLDQLTLRPLLNYTMNSKAAKKIVNKRKEHFKTNKCTVFQSLYNDAIRNDTKREIERVKVKEEITNQQPKRKLSKINVCTNFEERLLRSLQNSAQRKRKAQNKLEIDPSTGKSFFIPDTHLSKLTYFSHFKSTESIGYLPEHCPQPVTNTMQRTIAKQTALIKISLLPLIARPRKSASQIPARITETKQSQQYQEKGWKDQQNYTRN